MKTSHVLMGLILAGGFGMTASVGCSGGGGDPGGPGGGGGMTTDPQGPGPSSGSMSTGQGGSSTIMDISTSCADAPAMESAMNSLGGEIFVGADVINPAQDKDFFLVDMTAGEWYTIVTTANPDDDPMNIDTVVRLYNPGGTLIASGDDQFPRVDTDTEIFYHATATGTYCVEVMEFSDWVGDTAEGDPAFTYDVVVVPVDFTLYTEYNEDTEPNNTVGMTQVTQGADLTNGQKFSQLAGTLDMSDDEDWYSFTVPALGIGYSLNLTPSGVGDGGTTTSGFGSTKGPGLISLYDATGVVLLAQIDNFTNQPLGLDGMSSVPVTQNLTYQVRVQRPDMTVGANDFYFLKMFSSDILNDQEVADLTNFDEAGAEVGMTQANTDGSYSMFVGGTLGVGDVDVWSWPVGDPGAPTTGKEIAVACSSRAAGSGVVDMTIEAFEAGQISIHAAQIEDVAKGVLWSNAAQPNVTGPAITVANNNRVYIEIANGGIVDGPATSSHYLCGLHVSTP